MNLIFDHVLLSVQRSRYHIVLKLGRKLYEIVAVTADADHQITVQFRVSLGFFQGLIVYHIDLDFKSAVCQIGQNDCFDDLSGMGSQGGFGKLQVPQ